MIPELRVNKKRRQDIIVDGYATLRVMQSVVFAEMMGSESHFSRLSQWAVWCALDFGFASRVPQEPRIEGGQL